MTSIFTRNAPQFIQCLQCRQIKQREDSGERGHFGKWFPANCWIIWLKVSIISFSRARGLLQGATVALEVRLPDPDLAVSTPCSFCWRKQSSWSRFRLSLNIRAVSAQLLFLTLLDATIKSPSPSSSLHADAKWHLGKLECLMQNLTINYVQLQKWSCYDGMFVLKF